MGAVLRIRFHGRGGTGVKLAARIVSRAAFLAGRVAHDSPLYGAERRGAPVAAFVRIGDGALHERGFVDRPDVVVVADPSLLGTAAGVLDGVRAATLLLVNAADTAEGLAAHHGPLGGRTVVVNVSGIALAELGRHLLSAPLAAMVVKATGLATWERVVDAVRCELEASGVRGPLLAQNLAAARHVFDDTPAAGVVPGADDLSLPPAPAFVLPRLPARVAGPVIVAPGTSAQRTTEAWRVERPVVHRDACTRCFLCFALCPEGAIRLDAEQWPVVDYDHCKGCLVCVHECPTHAIEAVPEAAP